MKILHLLILIMTIGLSSFSQNLVVNGNFEEFYSYDSSTEVERYKAKTCDDSLWTYFHRIKKEFPWIHLFRRNSIFFGEPDRVDKDEFQEPFEGDSYAGLILYDSYYEVRTYLVGALTQPLKAGESYEISFAIQLSKCSNYAVNSIGMAISSSIEIDKSSTSQLTCISTITPSVQWDDRILKNKDSWVVLKGTIKAKGGENKLIIGNFQPDQILKIEKVKCKKCSCKYFGSRDSGYYHIDSVSLRKL